MSYGFPEYLHTHSECGNLIWAIKIMKHYLNRMTLVYSVFWSKPVLGGDFRIRDYLWIWMEGKSGWVLPHSLASSWEWKYTFTVPYSLQSSCFWVTRLVTVVRSARKEVRDVISKLSARKHICKLENTYFKISPKPSLYWNRLESHLRV